MTSRKSDWIRALIITPILVGIVWLAVFLVLKHNGDPDPRANSIYYCFFLPGGFAMFPILLAFGHSSPGWFLFIFFLFTWILYTQCVYGVIRWYRRKRHRPEASLGLRWKNRPLYKSTTRGVGKSKVQARGIYVLSLTPADIQKTTFT